MNSKSFFSELNEEQINELLKYAPKYSNENLVNVKEKFRKKTSKIKSLKVKRRSFLAASVVAMFILFSGFVYAGVIDLTQLYEKAFGGNGEYVSKYGENINKGCEYDGIVLKVLSAFNDSDELVVFYTLSDTKEERLSENTVPLPPLNSSCRFGPESELLSYDKESKTATFMTSASLYKNDKNKNINLSIGNFCNQEYKSVIENEIALYSILENHMYDGTDKTRGVIYNAFGGNETDVDRTLYKDELSIPFSNLSESLISNVGFINGKLHIQVRNTSIEKVVSNVSLINNKGEVIYSPSTTYPFIDESIYEYGFIHWGAKLSDYVYEDINDISQIKDLKIKVDYVEFGENHIGNWKVEFKIPEEAQRINVPITNKIVYLGEEMDARKIILSPRKLSVYYKSLLSHDQYEKLKENNKYKDSESAFVTYKDGTKVEFKLTNWSILNQTFTGNVVELDKVKSVTINGKEFPINDNN